MIRKTFKFLLTKYILVLVFLTSENLFAKNNFFVPTNVSISADIGKFLYYGFIINQYNKFTSYSYSSSYKFLKPTCPKFEGNYYEFNIATSFKKIILDVDFGYANTKWNFFRQLFFPIKKENLVIGEQESKGILFKYGFCYNFLVNTNENNSAFIGIKHAVAFFNSKIDDYKTHEYGKKFSNSEKRYSMKIDYLKNKKDAEHVTLSQKNLLANWFEIVAGTKLKISKYIHIGSTFRYKFFLNIHKNKLFDPFDIPGWGRTDDYGSRPCLGFNFYLSFNLPLKKITSYNRMDYREKKDQLITL